MYVCMYVCMYVLYRSVTSRTLRRRSYSYRGVLPCVGGVYHVCMYYIGL